MGRPWSSARFSDCVFLSAMRSSAVERLSKGGLLVVPAAPALRNLAHDVAYREALLGADIAIADSSLMVMLWNLMQGDNIRRLSGLEYLAELLTRADVPPAWQDILDHAQSRERVQESCSGSIDKASRYFPRTSISRLSTRM